MIGSDCFSTFRGARPNFEKGFELDLVVFVFATGGLAALSRNVSAFFLREPDFEEGFERGLFVFAFATGGLAALSRNTSAFFFREPDFEEGFERDLFVFAFATGGLAALSCHVSAFFFREAAGFPPMIFAIAATASARTSPLCFSIWSRRSRITGMRICWSRP